MIIYYMISGRRRVVEDMRNLKSCKKLLIAIRYPGSLFVVQFVKTNFAI